ncbi:MAG: FadR family transcriptional regulator [Rhodobacteraceae bacterium]|jgi:DNA-binding FadR family transcriptional regulator|nr:FadR family transcriptional regulator [Paracoccaceae bacterium]
MTTSASKRRSVASLPLIDTAPGYKRVADLIETEILSGRLPVGNLLPTEGELSEQLGVHRSTVREGIRALENSGLIKRVGGKRLKIVVPEAKSVARVNTRALGMRAASFRQLWDVQMQLEPFSARRAAEAAENTSDELKARLRDNLAELEADLDDDEAIINDDIAFHRLIAEMADNEALSLAIAPIAALLFSATIQLYEAVPAARHRLLQAHRAIGAAVLAGDPDEAECWMERHIRDFRRGYEIGGLNMNAPIKLDTRSLSAWQ